MIRAYKAQLLAMKNRSTILGLAIPCIGIPIAILVTFLLKESFRAEVDWTAPGTLTVLLVNVSFIFAAAAIIMVGRAVGSKFDYGTMQVALTHQSSRLRLISGIVAAAITGVLIALAAATVAMIAAGWIGALVFDIDTSGYFTADSLRASTTHILRIAAMVTGLGIITGAVATVTRSSAIVIAGMLAWTLAVETLALLVWSSSPKVLPAAVLLGIANPEEGLLSLSTALIRGGLWVTAAAAIGLLVFQRREVSA
ncbi:MAG: hypothetical protein ACC652_00580 [Acidimicrobiales bacterium]